MGYPAVVEVLRTRVRKADALLFATPEYNRSFSGVLKNAIDWLSRPPEQPLAGKVASVIGASPGALGTVLANYHLRQVLSVLGIYLVPGGEVLVGGVGTKINDEGVLTDDHTRTFLASHLESLLNLAVRLG